MPVTINDFVTQMNHWGFCGFISVLQKIQADGFIAPNDHQHQRHAALVQDFRAHAEILSRENRQNGQMHDALERHLAWIMFEFVILFIDSVNEDDANAATADETLRFTNAFWIRNAAMRNVAAAELELMRIRLNFWSFRLAFLKAFEHYYTQANLDPNRHEAVNLPYGLALSHNAMHLLLRLSGIVIEGHQAFLGNAIVGYNGQRNCILGVQLDWAERLPDFPNFPDHWIYVDATGNVSNYGDTYVADHLDMFRAWPIVIQLNDLQPVDLGPLHQSRIASIFRF